LAKQSRDNNQSRRLLSLAAVLDGTRIDGMDRQTLRDWVHRFNTGGPEALLDAWTNGPTPRLSSKQKSELAALVDAGHDTTSAPVRVTLGRTLKSSQRSKKLPPNAECPSR
jgi:transposase